MTPETPIEAIDRLLAVMYEFPLYIVKRKDIERIRELHPDAAPYRHPVRASAPEQVEVE